LLDTNIISDLIRNPKGKAAKRIAKVGEDSICTSVIVAAELRYGCAKSGSSRLLEAVEELLDEINILPFDVPADAEYGGIRAELDAAGKPIGSNDFLIAAHAYTTGPRSLQPTPASSNASAGSPSRIGSPKMRVRHNPHDCDCIAS
jgi:tRNA(fMet)-specific endonuclease VapC